MFADRTCHPVRALQLAVSLAAAIALAGACQSGGGGGGGGSNGAEAGSAAAGQLVYDESCVGCHGTPGANDGNAPDLAGASSAQIRSVLNGGEHAGGQPENLEAGAYDDLAAYLGGDEPEGEDDQDQDNADNTNEPTPAAGVTSATEACAACLSQEGLDETVAYAEYLQANGVSQNQAVPELENAMALSGVDTASCPQCAEAVAVQTYAGDQAPADPGTGGTGAVDPNLVGSWLYEDNYWSGDFSSTSSTTAILNADGTFEIRTVWFGGDGSVSGASDQSVVRGRWSASNGSLSLTYEDGSREDYGYYTENMAGDLLLLLTDAAGAQTMWTYQG